jgi:lysophosphatidate acyltransferase
VLQDAAELVKTEGKNVVIFPEGVRSYATEARLLPFKRGAIVLAVKANHTPIVPTVIGNFSRIFDFQQGTYSSGDIHVKVLNPISTAFEAGERESDAIDRILAELRSSMLEALMQISK